MSAALTIRTYRKRVRCTCGRRLGTYEAQFWREYVQLRPMRLPRPMVLWDVVLGPRPDSGPFFGKERPNVERADSHGRAFPRYRWRCGCGRQIILRGDTLRERWAAGQGTETV